MANALMLTEWVEKCVQEGQWKNHHDLHIDIIYGKTPKKFWIDQGLELLDAAKEMIDTNRYVIILAIPLREIKLKNDKLVTFHSLKATDLSHTPPSLYIYEKKWKPLKSTLSEERMLFKNEQHTVFLNKSIEGDLVYRVIDVLPANHSIH